MFLFFFEGVLQLLPFVNPSRGILAFASPAGKERPISLPDGCAPPFHGQPSSCIAPALTVYVRAYIFYIIAARRGCSSGSIISIDTHPLLQRFTLLMLSPIVHSSSSCCAACSSATPQYVGKTHTYKGATTFRICTHTHTLQFYLAIIIEHRVYARHIQTFQQCSVSTTKRATIKLKNEKN